MPPGPEPRVTSSRGGFGLRCETRSQTTGMCGGEADSPMAGGERLPSERPGRSPGGGDHGAVPV